MQQHLNLLHRLLPLLLTALPMAASAPDNWLLADVVRASLDAGARLVTVQADFVTCTQ